MAIFGKKRTAEKERVNAAASSAESHAAPAAQPGNIGANAPLSGARMPSRPGFMSRIVSHNRSDSDPQGTVLSSVGSGGALQRSQFQGAAAASSTDLSTSQLANAPAPFRNPALGRASHELPRSETMHDVGTMPTMAGVGAVGVGAAGAAGAAGAGGTADTASLSAAPQTARSDTHDPPSMGPGAMPESTQGAPAPAGAMPPTPERTRQQTFVYPWGLKHITMNPPRFLDENRRAPPGVLSPPPFPRYGHATNQTTSANNEVFVFGGLVRDSVKNDMYVMRVDPMQVQRSSGIKMDVALDATLVQTSGQAPLPRVGHAAVLVSNVFILWGGDTKIRAEDRQDEALYLLNLNNREWTRVLAGGLGSGSGPVGRYGHSLSILGSNLLVFGGQVESTFFDELWCFDLNSLKETPVWQLVRPAGPAPARRTGHSSVTFQERMYIFGGTDGNYHYNDTWCFDFASHTWTELKCVGYIPAPREGHAACMVDDVMYIFGGRGVDGNDLGDLASFKISSSRWFMFAHMGPAPFGRSGHTMVTTQNRILVVGGESFTGSAQDEPTSLHVLDTTKIKYPAKSERSNGSLSRPSMEGAAGAVPTAPPQEKAATSPGWGTGATPSAPSGVSPMVPAGASAASATDHARSPEAVPGGLYPASPAPALNAQPGEQPPATMGPPTGAPVPTFYTQTDASANGPGLAPSAMGPPADSTRGAARPAGSEESVAVAAPPLQSAMIANGMLSPAAGRGDAAGGGWGSGEGPGGGWGRPAGPAGQPEQPGQPGPYAGLLPAQNEERGTGTGLPYGVDPGAAQGRTAAAAAPGRAAQPTNGFAAPLSGGAEDAGTREAWLATQLALAVKQGFVPSGAAADETLDVERMDVGTPGSEQEAMVKSLLALKTQVTSLRAELVHQMETEEARVGAQERTRVAALQEAAYYRAKLIANETGSLDDRSRLERERIAQLEKLVTNTTRENAELERKTAVLVDQAKLESRLRLLVEERLGETTKRAVAAEEAQMKVYDEYSMLQKHSYLTESLLRDHAAQIASLSSTVAQHQAERDSLEDRMSNTSRSADTNRAMLGQFQEALSAAHARNAEYERQRSEHQRQADAQTSTMQQLRAELQAQGAQLESRNQQLKQQAATVTELETLAQSLQREAQAHREAAQGGLAQLLAQHQSGVRDGSLELSRDGANQTQQHLEHIQALQDEAQSMRHLHEEARTAANNMAAALQQATERSNQLQRTNNVLFAEVTSQRTQLATALHELAAIREQTQTSRSTEEQHTRVLEETRVKNMALRQLLAEHHIQIPDEDTLADPQALAERQVADLTRELDAHKLATDRNARELQQAQEQLHRMGLQWEARMREVRQADGAQTHAELDALRKRAEEAEYRLEEAALSHQERTSQLENDYLTAVQFVRNTENMLRRLKEEHLKLRQDNAELRAGLTGRASALSASVSDARSPYATAARPATDAVSPHT
ncbi:hypothetical protein MSPP1_000337 [Malassezia sp. CBS 17886]|nr:hypothetical protein MSPP1_000337 [Malassezia sp. CBS 17886]